MSRSMSRQDALDRLHQREQRANLTQKMERPRRPNDCSRDEELWIPEAAGAGKAPEAEAHPPQQRKSRPRRLTSAVDKEMQDKIDRENRLEGISPRLLFSPALRRELRLMPFHFRILLRKILEQHHGIRRHSDIPASRRLPRSNSATRPSTLAPPSTGPRTSNQVGNWARQSALSLPRMLNWPCHAFTQPISGVFQALGNTTSP